MNPIAIIAAIPAAFAMGIGTTWGMAEWSQDTYSQFGAPLLWALKNGIWLFPMTTAGVAAVAWFNQR